jgi:K+-transporting ATPase KdpF subunit
LGARPRLREVVTGGNTMDYVIAGIASVLLFFYLIYALLKPERF